MLSTSCMSSYYRVPMGYAKYVFLRLSLVRSAEVTQLVWRDRDVR